MSLFLVPVLPLKLVVLAMMGLLTSPKEITIGYAAAVPGALSKGQVITVRDSDEIKVLLRALEIVESTFVDGASAKLGGPPLRFVQFGDGRQLELHPDELVEIEAGNGTILVQIKPGFIKEINRIASKHARRPIDILGMNKNDM